MRSVGWAYINLQPVMKLDHPHFCCVHIFTCVWYTCAVMHLDNVCNQDLCMCTKESSRHEFRLVGIVKRKRSHVLFISSLHVLSLKKKQFLFYSFIIDELFASSGSDICESNLLSLVFVQFSLFLLCRFTTKRQTPIRCRFHRLRIVVDEKKRLIRTHFTVLNHML